MVIEEEVVELIWKQVAGYDGVQATRQMDSLRARQPDLIEYVIVALETMGEDSLEMAIYVMFVVCSIFEQASEQTSNGALRRVTNDEVVSAHKSNQQLRLTPNASARVFHEKYGPLEQVKQPNVTRYVFEALMEADEGPDPVPLSQDQISSIYLILRTVIDVLDAALTQEAHMA